MGTESPGDDAISTDIDNQKDGDEVDLQNASDIELDWPYDIPRGYQAIIYELAEDEEQAQEIAKDVAMNTIHNLFINNVETEGIPKQYKDLLLALQDELGDDSRKVIIESFCNIVNQTYIQNQD